jgi:tetratricopeptide (TPR) repeat protein
MLRSMPRLAVLASIFANGVRLGAQVPEQHGGHAEQLGRVRFVTSCRGAARRGVERGVAYLHSFWYEQATVAFNAASAADSSCAMAFWGQAMSLLHPLWTPPSSADAQVALSAIARGLAAAKTTRERDYLGAIRVYYADYDGTDPRTRLVRYALAMDRVRRRSPADSEAAIFYALALIAVGQANATDTTFTYQKRADSILEPLFRREPQHPGLAHYLIHTNDVPQLAEHGLYAARRYAEIAPDAPHAQHMPSHIFTRLGMWDDAIASNLRSAAAARAYEVERGMTAMWDQRAHALDYLAYAYLQEGRDSAARRVVGDAAAAPAGYPAGSLIHEYAFAAIPARMALERGEWGEAARLSVRPAPEWPAVEAITHFARAIGAARSNDTAAARQEVLLLRQIASTLTVKGGAQAYWAEQVAIQRLAAAAWLEVATGDTAAGIVHAGQAADREDRTQKHPVTPGPVLPARELEGDLLLLVGKPGDAAKAYAATLALSPNRARSLFSLARAAELTGDTATALAKYQEFLKLMAKADGARPEITIARRAVRLEM